MERVFGHGYANERQLCELHTVGKRGGGEGEMAMDQTRANNLQTFSRPFDPLTLSSPLAFQ